MESERRWSELASLREELDHEGVVVPMIASRIDGKPRQPSERARQFARDLAFADSWSGISAARRRRAA